MTVPLVLGHTTNLDIRQTDKTNLSHDGLNPAHDPFSKVNNLTLEAFYNFMIGRADIEGSKSNVAMNAWLPQISYPCGKFSDIPRRNSFSSKGSIGHAFTIHSACERMNKAIFSPFSLHEISVLIEIAFGHLWWLLTDVPPQPNSQPVNVLLNTETCIMAEPDVKE